MDDNTLINPSLVAKSIGFHGQPLQKIWEGERGDVDLLKIGVINPDYSAYQMRQKHFTFQNRAKRLRLHQFIAKNAKLFFRMTNDDDVPQKKELSGADGKLRLFWLKKIRTSFVMLKVFLFYLRSLYSYATVRFFLF